MSAPELDLAKTTVDIENDWITHNEQHRLVMEIRRLRERLLPTENWVPCIECGHSFPVSHLLPATPDPEASAICRGCAAEAENARLREELVARKDSEFKTLQAQAKGSFEAGRRSRDADIAAWPVCKPCIDAMSAKAEADLAALRTQPAEPPVAQDKP